MRKRHFVVREVDGTYQAKEIEARVAQSMSIFGIPMGEYQSVEVSHYFFYFCPMTAKQAKEIAEKLSQELLNENHSNENQ